MKFKKGDKVCMIGNDISDKIAVKRGMDGIVVDVYDDMTFNDGFPYLVDWKCMKVWTKEHQMKRIKS